MLLQSDRGKVRISTGVVHGYFGVIARTVQNPTLSSFQKRWTWISQGAKRIL